MYIPLEIQNVLIELDNELQKGIEKFGNKVKFSENYTNFAIKFWTNYYKFNSEEQEILKKCIKERYNL